MPVVAIDQGTTSTRSFVLDESGGHRISHSVFHRQHYPKPGRVEHDPEELVANIRACLNVSGIADAVGIDNQGESCLAWDAETKEALSPVIVWQDRRTGDLIERLKTEGREELVLEKTGLPLDPYFSAAKLGWIVENLPAAEDALKAGRLRLGTTDAFFLDRLTGRCVTDISTASRTSLMNLQTGAWDEDLCALFGVPMECLPEIVPTTGDFGAVQTGHCVIPVTASIVDQQAALYGFGCRKPGDVKMTFGTGAFALMVTGSEIHNRPDIGILPTVAWQKAGEQPVYAIDGGVYTASAAVNWAKSLGLFETFEEISRFDGPAAIDRNVVFVPALSGLGCPHWDDRARGTWLGLSLDHGPEVLVQAVLEGVAFRAAEVLDAMNACVPGTGPLPVDGGMSNNPYFLQFLADITGRTVSRSGLAELTALGTARLAAEYANLDQGFELSFDHFPVTTDRTRQPEKFRKALQVTRSWPG